LILDDYRGNGLKFEDLLQVLDGRRLMLPIKGGHTYALWTRVIITSNTIPENWYRRLAPVIQTDWFEEEQEDYRHREQQAFWRRITLHVRDIDIVAPYPACIANVNQRVETALAKKRENAVRVRQGNEDQDPQASLVGLW